MKRSFVEVLDTSLAYVEFGGEGTSALLLHGLMGCATTWATTAQWLTLHYRVIALDQRGHGWSDKPDQAYTRDHYVNDAAAVIEQLDLGPVVVIGHSMGALNAWVLAARYPDLVRGVVLAEMSPTAASCNAEIEFRQWLDTWPIPFSTFADLQTFFDNQRPCLADYFGEVMVEEPNGWRPVFQFEHMLQSLTDWSTHNYGHELEAVQCPALVVRGTESHVPQSELQEMARRLSRGRYIEVAGASHVIHYDQPMGWRTAIEPFLLDLMV